MFIIGLTGNIASGKTTVARVLSELGAAVLDADALVHAAYGPGTEVARQVAHEFGPHVMQADGGVDRTALGHVVFSNPDNLRKLEGIVWPAVATMREAWLAQCQSAVAVVDAVKLVESGFSRRCDSIWVVRAPLGQQRRRLIDFRGLSEAVADQRLGAQPPIDPKLAVANVVLENDGTEEQLRERVARAWEATIASELRVAR